MVVSIRVTLTTIIPLGIMLGPLAFGDSTCIDFPPAERRSNIPFASIAYVTAANAAGDHLVVGALIIGVDEINANVPLPSIPNQMFCDAQVQLAPQQFYPNVYVPTAAERSGNFSAFTGLLVNPANNQPYPGGIIPSGQLGAVYAWRIGTAQSPSAARGWNPTGSMSVARFTHAAVLLPTGKVLVVGSNNEFSARAELYDPTTGTFSPAGNMRFPQGPDLTATLLGDGRVLIEGGRQTPSAAELYDPILGQFIVTGGTVEPHGFGQTATLLSDGRVLVVGGLAVAGNDGTTNSGAEIYDPRTGSFAKTGSLPSNPRQHTATLLSDGRVLVAGGTTLPAGAAGGPPGGGTILKSAVLYDPSSGQFSSTGSMQAARGGLFAVMLPGGKVLIGSGYGDAPTSAELYDPTRGSFTPTGSMSGTRDRATLVGSGQVLVSGGYTNSADLYNPTTGTFTATGSMAVVRGGETATLLFDGRVLVTGGTSSLTSGPITSAELYTPLAEGLATSQTGLTFRAAQGAGASTQTVVALSNTDTIPFNVTVKTYSGGGWLKATPASATISPTAAPVTLSIIADTTNLAAQDYYGAVTLTPTDGKHPPVSISIVLSIVPAGSAAPPAVSPSGLVFLTASVTSVKPQSFGISNLTSKPITFTGTGSASPNWFDFNPKSGTINGGQTVSITVTPAINGLNAGVYRGSVKLTFNDNSTQTVDLLLVISPTAGMVAGQAAEAQATGCTPNKLLPVFTTIGTGFTTPVAWPTPLAVQVVDDCGVAVNNGSVAVSFSNGDAPLSLLAIGNATWTATWVPTHNATSAFAVRADARQSSLSGSVQVNGQVALNPKVPIVAAAGVVSSGDYTSSPAQGLLVSIFGTALADGEAGAINLPLPQQLGSTRVVVAGATVPLLYVSDGQINLLVPYDLAINATHQLVVQRGNAISVPVPIAVYDSEPAILATGGNGMGQGVIFKIDAQGNSILADAQSPATTGDVLVMYCVGLGAVHPNVKAGDPAPFDPSTVIAPVTVTIGGQPATVMFSGLTPGAAGLYQVNAVVPNGITPADKVPVVVSVAGKGSSGNIYMGIK